MAEQGQTQPFGSRVEWELTHKRSGQSRTFVQTELPIEGEARMLGLVRQLGEQLREKTFDWSRLGEMFDRGDLEWEVIVEALHAIEEFGPQYVVESAAILLGIYPTNEDGTPNTAYDTDKQFLRGAINSAQWVNMVRAYADQNDYQRMVRPFWQRLGIQFFPPVTPEPSGEPSTLSSLPDTETPVTSSDATPPAPTPTT